MRARMSLAATLGFPLVLSACPEARLRDDRVLTVSIPYDVVSLEPGRRDRLADFAVLSNVYEPLVTTDAHLAVAPALATRWENPDERTWVFHLRPLARFHDGSPLGADDVVYSFRRLLDDPTLEARRHVLAIEDVGRASESSVVLRTRTPLADFLNRVRFIHVVRRGSTSGELRNRPNGTGPFRVLSFRERREIAFVRNDAYWGPHTRFERAVLRLDRSPDEAAADFDSRVSDLAQVDERGAAESVSLRRPARIHRVPSLTVKMLRFDVTRDRTAHSTSGHNPFRDRRVREAVHLGLDRERLGRMLGTPGIPMYQLVPPFIFGFDPALPRAAYDPSRARALLTEAGWPGGLDVALHSRVLLADGADAVRRLLAEVGIRVSVRLLPDAEFFEATGADRRDSVMALTRFGCPTGDAANFLDAALHTREPEAGFGRANTGGYSSPEADGLIEEAARTLDPTTRKGILHRLMRIAMHDLPWIPLYIEEEVYLARPALVWAPRLDNYVILSEVGLR